MGNVVDYYRNSIDGGSTVSFVSGGTHLDVTKMNALKFSATYCLI